MNITDPLDHLHEEDVNIDRAVTGCLIVYAIAAIVIVLLIVIF